VTQSFETQPEHAYSNLQICNNGTKLQGQKCTTISLREKFHLILRETEATKGAEIDTQSLLHFRQKLSKTAVWYSFVLP